MVRKETTIFYVVPNSDRYTCFGIVGEESNWEDKRCPDYQSIALQTAYNQNWGRPIHNNYVELYDGEQVMLEPDEHMLKINYRGEVMIIK